MTELTKESFEPQMGVEIFLRVRGKLPVSTDSLLTKKELEDFIEEHKPRGMMLWYCDKQLSELDKNETVS